MVKVCYSLFQIAEVYKGYKDYKQVVIIKMT